MAKKGGGSYAIFFGSVCHLWKFLDFEATGTPHCRAYSGCIFFINMGGRSGQTCFQWRCWGLSTVIVCQMRLGVAQARLIMFFLVLPVWRSTELVWTYVASSDESVPRWSSCHCDCDCCRRCSFFDDCHQLDLRFFMFELFLFTMAGCQYLLMLDMVIILCCCKLCGWCH